MPIFHALCAIYDNALVKDIVSLAGISKIDMTIVDENNNNAIMQACLARNIPNIIYLAESGVDVNLANHLGGTALLHAVYQDDVELVEILVRQCGADPSVELAGKDMMFIAYHMARYDAWNVLRAM